MNKLNETITLMISDDYKQRFRSEYYQLKIRYEKLKEDVDNYGNNGFEEKCSKGLLKMQLGYMNEYLGVLKIRAENEGIVL